MENNYRKARVAHESSTFTDFANVETGKNYLVPEQTPEGPYGSPINTKLGKTTPWEKGQRRYSAFNYEFKSFHEDIPRQFPGAHPPHDDPEEEEEYLYTSK
ncbi:cytosolic protein [Bacillus piscicola]|uniref:cytosolic protein n=1 Tax=Bacillus piscicola TaxID=1632684 RepID=UPI001F096316|nr:cytosolic protein [Bacillus piscicola]